MKRKRRKKPLLARLKKEADRVLSLYVRANTQSEWGHCPLCPDQNNANPIQCCFHFIRRKRLATRWDTGNLVGACNRCNWIEYRNPDPSRAWFIRYRGVEKYLALVDRSGQSFTPTVEFLKQVIEQYKMNDKTAEIPS